MSAAPGLVSVFPPEISVVVPVYRNADSVRELALRVRDVMEGRRLSYEIVFVDDACPDGSLAALNELAAADPAVTVVSLSRNAGQHRAVLAGLRGSTGRRLVTMDADLQDPPEAIPRLLDGLDEGPAAVFAGRRGRYEGPGRLFTSRLFKLMLHALCGVPADAGMFVAMDRRMADRLFSFRVRNPFVVAMIGCSGLPVASVPVIRSPRTAGGSAYSSWKRFRTGCLAVGWVAAWKCGFGGRARADGQRTAP